MIHPRIPFSGGIVFLGLIVHVCCFVSAADETIAGNLSVTGDLDVGGSVLSVGTRSDSVTSPGFNVIYTDAEAPSVYFGSTRNNASWVWQNADKNQMRLGLGNKLEIFDQATPAVAKIVFDPAAGIQIGAPDPWDNYDIPTRLRIFGNSFQGESEETLVRLIRDHRYGVFYPATVDFKVSAYNGGGPSLNYNPATKLTIALKGGSSFNEAADVDVITFRADGRIGIGTGTPEAKLDLRGDLNVVGNVLVSGGINVSSINLPDGSALTTAFPSALYDSYGAEVVSVTGETNNISLGGGNARDGEVATAMGLGVAVGFASTATGDTTLALGYASLSAGFFTKASGFASVALGAFNVPSTGSGPMVSGSSYDLLVIGNGTVDSSWEPVLSNAFAVQNNGNVRAAGDIQARGGFRTPPMGDLSMGGFVSGANPADSVNGLGAGLRYPNGQ